MSATLDAPQSEFTREQLDFARRLQQEAQGRQQTPYRRALVERVEKLRFMRFQHGEPRIAGPISDLPGGGYQSYQLTAGRHCRYDLKDVIALAKEYQKNLEHARANGLAPPSLGSPPEREFRPTDIITPQDDTEALLMEQDQRKYRPVGRKTEGIDNVSELTAELNRLRMENQRLLEEARKSKK